MEALAMYSYTSLKLVILMWQYGMVDTFTAVNFIYNAGTQYGAIVISAMAEGNITDFRRVFFEPIAGVGVSYQFVKAAQTEAGRRARIATLAALFSSSAAVAVGSNPAANAGIGAGVAAHISYMRALLIQGGSCGSNILGSKVKDFKVVLDIHPIHPYRQEFTANCQITINNMFEDHRARRYMKASIQKIKTIAPTYLPPTALVSTQINTIGLIGWTCFGLGLIGFLTLGACYSFQCIERKRWQNKNDQLIIYVTASLSD